jgi:hypothetical protein
LPRHVGARRVALHKPNNTTLMIDSDMPPRIEPTFDLSETTDLGATFSSGEMAHSSFAQ